MLNLQTKHFVLDISRAYDAFIYAQDKAYQDGTAANEPNPATLFFADITTPKYLALAGLYQVTTTIGDTFMVCEQELKCTDDHLQNAPRSTGCTSSGEETCGS